MPATTVSIVCDVSLPTALEFSSATFKFQLSEPDYDTLDNDVIPTTEVSAAANASGVATVNLWPVDRGVRNSFYRVSLSAATIQGGVPVWRDYTLGVIRPPSISAPHDLADLLAQSTGGIIVGSTIYATLADAVQAALDAVFDGIGYTQDTFTSRALAISSDVMETAHQVVVHHNGRAFTYVRTAANTEYAALTTNGGTVFWVPLSTDGTYDPAAWGDGWPALWKCAQWQIAALGSVTIRATGQIFQKPVFGADTTRRITAAGIPIDIDLGNCLMHREETDLEPFFAFAGGYSANTVLTGVAYSNVTYVEDDEEEGEGSGSESTATKRTVLTLTSATGFEGATGQVAFISSADPNPHHSPRLMGEHVVIDRIAGTTANVQGRLYGNYTTAGGNVRLWLMSNVKISVRGGVWEDLGNRDIADRNTKPMIHIETAKSPHVAQLTVRFAESHVVQFVNCYDYVADGFSIDYMANKTNPWHDDNNPVGENPVAYGVRVANSQGGVTRNMRGRHMRHIVDHLCLPASSFSAFSYLRSGLSPVGIGATIACRAENCFSHGASSAPFGTHDGTIGCIFTGNTVIQPRTTAWAFRGVNHMMSGNRDEGAVTVFRGFIGSNWIGPPAEAATRGIVVRDHTSVNPRGSFLTLNDGAESFRVDGWTIMFTTDADPEVSPQRIIWLKNGGDVSISNLTIEARREITIGELCLIDGTNDATIRLEGGSILDYSGTGEIQTMFKNIGTGDCTHMVRNLSAHRVPDQSQFVQSLFTDRAPAVGSHIRQSRIVGIWSQEQVAPNRATVLAAYVSPDLETLSYVQNGEEVKFRKDPSAAIPAITLADGSVWSPLGVSTPEHFGAGGNGVANDTAPLTLWGERGGIMYAGGRYVVAAAGSNAGGVLCRLLASVDVTCGPQAQFIAGADLDADIIRFTAQLSEYSAGRIHSIRWRGGYFNQKGQLPGAILPNSATWVPARTQGTGPTDGLYVIGWVLDGGTYYSGADTVQIEEATFYGGDHWEAADNGGDSGIFVAGARQAIIKHNLFIGLRDLGVYPSGFPAGEISNCNLVVSQNKFINCHWGIAPKRQFDDVIIEDNDFQNTPQCIVLSGLTGVGGTGGRVAGNIARRAWQVVRADDVGGIEISDNHSHEHGCALANGTLPLSVFTSRNGVVDLRGAVDSIVRDNVLHSIHADAVTAGWTMHTVRLREGEFTGARISQGNLVSGNIAMVGSGAVIEESGLADLNRFTGNRAPVAVAAVVVAGAGSVNEDAPVVTNQNSTTHTGTTVTTDLRTQAIGAGLVPRIGDKLTVTASGTFAGAGTKQLFLVIGGGTMSFAASADGTSPAWNLRVEIINNGANSRADGVLAVGGETLQVQNTNPAANGASGYTVTLQGDLGNTAGSIVVDGWRIEANGRGIAP